MCLLNKDGAKDSNLLPSYLLVRPPVGQTQLEAKGQENMLIQSVQVGLLRHRAGPVGLREEIVFPDQLKAALKEVVSSSSGRVL